MPFKAAITLILLLLIICGLPTSAKSESEPKDRYYYEKRGDIVWEIQTDEKVIALTFDDGPDPVETPMILDLLKKYDAKATFFTVGKRVEKHPELLIREVVEGHEIANHTYTHPFFTRNTPVSKIVSEMKKTHDIVLQTTGSNIRLFRPPGGLYSDNLIAAAKQMGYSIILWSWDQDTRDWKRPGVGVIVRRSLSGAHNGDIVLFHDYVSGNTQTVAALRLILPELKERGFRFVTVSELLTIPKKKE